MIFLVSIAAVLYAVPSPVILPFAILLTAAAVIYGFGFYRWHHRIPLARAILKGTKKVLDQYPAAWFAGYLAMFVSACVTSWMLAAAFGTVFWFFTTTGNSLTSFIILIYYQVFFFYWTIQIICNTLHFTVSGLFAEYFLEGVANTPGNVTITKNDPIMRSAQRALTSSFGSICYGSLVIGIAQLIGAVTQILAAFSMGIPLFGALGDVIKNVTKYSFVYCSIYGTDFCTSSRDTKDLFIARGLSAILNDSIINSALIIGSLVTGVVTGGLTFAFSYACMVTLT